MKGTDCTQEQIDHARRFLAIADKLDVPDEQMVTVSRGGIVRVLAWYGAVRFMAGRDGTGGTLEEPGELEVRPRPAPPEDH